MLNTEKSSIELNKEKKTSQFKQQHYVLFEGEAAGADAPKAGKLSDSLLDRRLMKAREEKGELAAKVAKLPQARLKDAEDPVQPAPSPKVMRSICFSKFNLQKFVTLSLTDNKIGWSQFGKIQDSRSVAR